MANESGGRPPREKRQQRTRRGSLSKTRRYRLLHTTLFMLGAILLTAAVVISVISIVNTIIL